MADIMEEAGCDNQHAFVVGKAEPAARDIGKEHRTERVLEARVVRTWVHEVRKAELPDITEALQGRGVEQGKREILNLNIAVDRVLDDLHKYT